MNRDKDWIDALRNRLRSAEASPPVDGWARLERELGRPHGGAEADGTRMTAASPAEAPLPRKEPLRGRLLRIVAAAAALVLLVGAGELFLRRGVEYDGPDRSSLADAGAQSAGALPTIPAKTVRGAEEKIASRNASAAPLAAEAPALRTGANHVPKETVSPSEAQRQETASEAERLPKRDAEMLSARETEPAASEAKERHAEQARTSSPGKHPKTASGSIARKNPDRFARGAAEPGYAPARRRTSFSLFAGGALTGGNGNSGMSGKFAASMDGITGDGSGASAPDLDGSPLAYYDLTSNAFEHHQPLSFGLSVRREFAHGLSLETGVNYTLLRSEVSYWKGARKFSQKLHFIGIPLRLNWRFFEQRRFSAYIGAGGMVEKCVAAKFGTRPIDEPGLQWSATGAAGVQYQLGRVAGLYFEPEVSYYFTDTRLRTSRTDAPLSLTLRLGVRFSF